MGSEISRLSDAESVRLGELEDTIRHGLDTFLEVGTALLEIRESRLYRDKYLTFKDYCLKQWGLSKPHAYRLISAAEVCQNLCQEVGPMGPIPNNERQIRPLAALEPAKQREAWEEAVVESNGKPTAKVVQAIVDRKIRKTRVNGKPVEDPPEIAEARKSGAIPDAAVVEIIEPDDLQNPVEAVRQEQAERAAIQAEVSDEDWVATLPLYSKLSSMCQKTFAEDALLFRHVTAARKTFAHHATRAFNKVRRKGAYALKLQFFLGTNGPEQWLLCPSTDNGGCGGCGHVTLIGQCPKCRGRGYWIK